MFKRFGILTGMILGLVLIGAAHADGLANPVRISFLPGTTAYTLTTGLTPGVSQNYVLGILAQQELYITKSGDASIQVFDPLGNPLTGTNAQPGPYGVAIAQTGDYMLVLSGDGLTTVSLYIPPSGAPTLPAAPLPLYRERIQFAPGSASSSLALDLAQGVPAAYVLQILAQQQVYVAANGNATVALLDPQNNALPPLAPQRGMWMYAISQAGDHTLVLMGEGQVTVGISIPPSNPTPTPVIPRIRFAPGTVSFAFAANLAQGARQDYVLRVLAEQTMYITTSASVQVLDPGMNPVPPIYAHQGEWAFPIAQSGDYTLALSGNGPVTTTIYIPPLWQWF